MTPSSGPAAELPQASHVHVVPAVHGGAVILNLRKGQWYALNSTAEVIWREFCTTADLDAAVRAVASRYPADLHQRIRADAERLIAELDSRGLIVRKKRAGALDRCVASHAVASQQPVIAQEQAGPVGYRFRASVGLAMALLLLKFPFGLTMRIVGGVRRHWCRQDVTVSEASQMLVAIEAAARRYPGRAACLEHSLAAVLTAALARRRAGWAVGIAEDPYRFHAWIEAAGIPVIPSPEGDFTDFRRMLVI